MRWRKLRQRIIERDGCCVMCGLERSLHVHHINEDRTLNSYCNLVTLCKYCHRAVHKTKLLPRRIKKHMRSFGYQVVNR